MAKRKTRTKTSTKTTPRKKAAERTPAPAPLGDLKSGTNPLAEINDGLSPGSHRRSEDLIYESIMRGGGEPFGIPFEISIGSLTDKIVKFFRQRSFFGFEIFERSRPKRRHNKFTRYGASRFFGSYDATAAKRAAVRLNKQEKTK